MENKKRNNNFIMQAGILAAAGIITRIIGLLYRSPLTSIIGDEGNGYYSAAYNAYTIILLIASYSIPSAVSKVIAQKLAVKEYKNAHRMFKCALMYIIVVGTIACLAIVFFGQYMVEGEAALKVLRIFIPTIFFSGILGVLRGYFQAHKSMVQTSVSQILEQILNACVSVGAAYFFISSFMGTMEMYENPSTPEEVAFNTNRAVYGAMGSAVGTGAGVLIALIFMALIYLLNKKIIMRRVDHDTHEEVDSYKDIFKTLFAIVTPFILSTAIYNFSTFLNQTVYLKIMTGIKDVVESEAYTQYGIYAGKPIVISNIPIALASAMSSAIIPGISASFIKKEYDETRRSVNLAVKTTMLIAIPCAVGLAVLSKPVTRALFPQLSSLDAASKLLTALAISVVFYSLSTLSNAILQGIGRVNIPVINAAIALVAQTGLIAVLLVTTDLNLYALVIGNITYSGLMCILNNIAVVKYLNNRLEIKRTFLLPLLASAFMGGVAFGVYELLYMVLPINIVCLAVAILFAGIVYFVGVIKFGAVSEEELRSIPKGTKIISLAKKLHLL